MRLGLHLTDRCELDCVHCLRDPAQRPRDLPLARVESVLADAERLGITQVSLTGGEPTLHPALDRVLHAIASRGMTWDMVSNGLRFPQLLPEASSPQGAWRSLRSVTFSLDGKRDTHDRIRGAGSFDAVMRSVLICVARGVPFGLQMAVHAVNQGELEWVAMEAAQLGARHVSFPMTMPSGSLHDAGLWLPAAEWWRVRSRVEKLSRALAIKVVLPEGYPDRSRLRRCDALRNDTLHVDVYGRVSLCCNLSQVPGAAGEVASEAVAAGPEVGLLAAQDSLVSLIEGVMRARVAGLTSPPSPWSDFSCNSCRELFGLPAWTEDGAQGPQASRERWTGAWNVDRQRVRLKLLS